jgi:hypothetical protein
MREGRQDIRIWMASMLTSMSKAAAQSGGSRSYARSRLVTLSDRLPGSFPVHSKVQERSCDPRHP